MSFGYVRDRFPRARITLPGESDPLVVEFIVDTGFDGELALPPEIARRLGAEVAGHQALALADGTTIISPYFRVMLDWQDEERLTEVLLLDGNPLLGVQLLDGYWFHAQMVGGGEVELESL